ncbi:MAG TPA: polymer-forming cytoskeletal protein [Sphingobacteriaceae bacterium]
MSKSKTPTLVSEGVTFEGQIRSGKVVRIEGMVIGDISETDNLIVGESGSVEGNIMADSILVFGTVCGNITGKFVDVRRTASISGNVTAGELAMEKGALYTGRLMMGNEVSETDNGPV